MVAEPYASTPLERGTEGIECPEHAHRIRVLFVCQERLFIHVRWCRAGTTLPNGVLPERAMPSDPLDIDERCIVLRIVQQQYHQTCCAEQGRLLDRLEALTGLHSRSLIRLLRGPCARTPWRVGGSRLCPKARAAGPHWRKTPRQPPSVWASRFSASVIWRGRLAQTRNRRACQRSRSRGVGARYMRSRNAFTSSCRCATRANTSFIAASHHPIGWPVVWVVALWVPP